jgi:hypothetical protein
VRVIWPIGRSMRPLTNHPTARLTTNSPSSAQNEYVRNVSSARSLAWRCTCAETSAQSRPSGVNPNVAPVSTGVSLSAAASPM